MTTIPLCDLPKHANAWHRVRAPGGYELWRFDVDALADDRRIVVEFFEGSPTDEDYRRRFFNYVRNPTRVSPPVPAECIGVEVAVYRGMSVERSLAATYPPEQFSASTEALAVQIGPHRVSEIDGVINLWSGGDDFSLQIQFRPRLTDATERDALPGADRRTIHRWIVPQPLSDVTGLLRIGSETIALSGRGFHDHIYGTGAIPITVSRWIRGRLSGDDRCVAFEIADQQLCVADFASGIAPAVRMEVTDYHSAGTKILQDTVRLSESGVLEEKGVRSRVICHAEQLGGNWAGLCDIVRFRKSHRFG